MEDMRYVVELLTKINTLKKDDTDFYTYFKEGRYSLWSAQQYFLVSQIKEYSSIRNLDVLLRRRKSRWGILSSLLHFGFNVIVVGVTLFGVVSIFFRKIKVITFSSDFLNADKKPTPRLRNIYNFFDENNVSFIEILHITSIQSFFKNLPRRSHLGVYFEAFDACSLLLTFFSRKKTARNFMHGIDFSSLHGDEEVFARFLVRTAVERIVALRVRVVLYEWFLKLTGAHSFVSVDDLRYVPELMFACEKVDIPSHVFQHSNFGFLPGMYLLPPEGYIFPTHFYTWNTYWERRVKEISPYFNQYASRISVGGRSFTPLQPPRVERKEPVREFVKKLTILIPYEFSLSSEYIWPYMDTLLSDERFTILFVLRGTIDQIDYTMQVHQYVPIQQRDNPRFVKIVPQDREKAIRGCDVIAGVYSGFLDESIETGVPVCIFKTPFIHVNRLDTDNLATLIDIEKGDLFSQFLEAYMTPNNVLAERRERVISGATSITKTLESIVG